MARDDGGDSTSTLGDSCIMEAKLSNQFNINQLIAISVVSSFIERNLHKELNSLTPVIMIGAPTAQICLYDCDQDILLISDKFQWVTNNEDHPNIIIEGLLMIWMTIHHR